MGNTEPRRSRQNPQGTMTIKKIVEIVETALSVRTPLTSATRTQTRVTRRYPTMVIANSSRRKSFASPSAAVARSGWGFEHIPITSGATLREPENADSLVELQSETLGTREFLTPGGIRT